MENTTEKKFLLQRSGYTLKSFSGDCSKRWHFVFYQVFDNGVKRRVRFYGGINRKHTAAGRYSEALALLTKLESGLFPERFEAVAISALLSDYFEQKAVYLRPKTRATYATKVNSFIAYCSEKRVDSLQHITKAFCLRWLATVKGSNVTVNSYRNTLLLFFELLRKDKRIESNPFRLIEKRSEEKVSKAPFSLSQIESLKAAMCESAPALWLACRLQYYCFVRPGELRLLKVEDLNIDEGFIKVPAAISKNKKAQVVSVPLAFLPELAAWVKGLPQNYYIANRAALPVGRDYFLKQHKKILNRLGFSSKYSFYSWKHTGAVMAVKAGINLKDLQLQMRHHSLDQLNEYLRGMGIMDSGDLKSRFPGIG
jgi:integrase